VLTALVFWGAACALFYIYLGYPILVWLVSKIRRGRPVLKKGFEPELTLIISAYNEAASIHQKIENSLSLDYPSEKLEILVVSDASSDGTDDIVLGYASRGVRLLRMEKRSGKTLGLNHAVSIAKGEVIVFSDANAFYDRDALRYLAAPFSDPEVGYVTGASHYIQKKDSFVGWSEALYWTYDLRIKELESEVSSMVGADGAMYAIRRVLYTPLKPQDINDFLNPLQIVAKGYRGIFEPAAVCHESTVSRFGEEYRRKVRIVSRSLRGLMQISGLLNPCRFGFYSIQLLSHKLLRWMTPLFIFSIALSNIALWSEGGIYRWVGHAQLFCYALALTGFLLSLLGLRLRFFSLPYYFVLMNLASLHAIWKSMRGQVQATWEPERETLLLKGEKRQVTRGFAIVLIIFLSVAYAFFFLGNPMPLEERSFCIVSGLLLHILVGYPLSLALIALLLRPLKDSPETDETFAPPLTLLILAYNEEQVIENKIKNALALDYPREKLQIVVASDGSTDGTEAICRGYAAQGVVLWAYQPRRGKIATINRAMQRIKREIVVLSDANVLYKPASLRMLVRHFRRPNVGAVSGKVSVSHAPNRIALMSLLYPKYENYIKEKESQIGSITGVDGAMYAIRRKLYREVPENVILDDLVISMNIARQKKWILFEPEAEGLEYAVVTVKEGFEARVRVMAGAVQALKQGFVFPLLNQPFLLYKFVSHKVLRWAMPFLLALLFILNVTLLGQKIYRVTLIVQVAFYTLALVGFVTKTSRVLFSAPFYFCMQNAATLVGIWRGLRGQQSVMWDKSERYVANDGGKLAPRQRRASQWKKP